MTVQMIKSILTTVVLAIAWAQAAEMAQLKGYLRVLPLDKRILRNLHRMGGVAALFLMLAVTALCVVTQGVYLRPARVALHVVLGTAGILVLITKAIITNRFRRHLSLNNGLGAAAGLLILGTFVLSALWYFWKGY
ncbi:MAG: DUF6529 family protein [Anaerolineae bacterium]